VTNQFNAGNSICISITGVFDLKFSKVGHVGAYSGSFHFLDQSFVETIAES